MQIDSNAKLAGLPILEVRRFLRETMHQSGWTKGWLTQTLSITAGRTRSVIAQLAAEGYIEPSSDGKEKWCNTSNGNALACATAARPLLRESAREKLEEFLTRVRFVNSPGSEFVFWAGEVVLFGSMLTQKPKVSDVDVSVRFDRKYEGEAFSKAADLRVSARQNGRSFRNILERAYWAESAVKLYLKNRSRSISMIEWNEEWLRTQPHEVIYRR